MLKKILVTDLKPGMYVSNIAQDGITLHQHEREGRVKDSKTILTLRKRGVKEVYIDVQQGDDSPEAITLDDAEEELQEKLVELNRHRPPHETSSSLEQESKVASLQHQRALNLVSQAMAAAQYGQEIAIQPFEEMADHFIDSVVRNQNALACLSRIRDKDNYLMEHSVNVAVLMAILGKHLELEPVYLQQCVTGALLHDIGKILIPDEVLHKPGKLTSDEFTTMKRHAALSKKILQKSKHFSQVSINIAGQHHERLDGQGYPAGLKGEDISPEGRMASVVDVYDAITADRVYHKGLTPSAALKRLLEWSGPHLDKNYVQAFIKAMGIYPVGSLVELDTGMVGLVVEESQKSLQPVIKLIYNLKLHEYCNVERHDLSQARCPWHIVRVVDPEPLNIKIQDFLN